MSIWIGFLVFCNFSIPIQRVPYRNKKHSGQQCYQTFNLVSESQGVLKQYLSNKTY